MREALYPLMISGTLIYDKYLKIDQAEFVARDGTKKVITSNVAPIKDRDGNIIGFVLVFKDITEQKKNEAQLALSQKMESIGRLAAGIAHEINTPMQYIGDNTRFLKDAFRDICEYVERIGALIASLEKGVIPADLVAELRARERELDIGYLAEEVPKAIEQSLEGIERVRKIVLAMKDFSHPGSREKLFVDINKAIEGTVTISRNEWKYVAELETDLERDLPLVYCVVDEINQVVLNMIINAAHAIKEAVKDRPSEKGRIVIKTRSEGGFVKIIISDTGTGIPQSIRSKIFDPFFTTKGVGKGTGQGLTIAHDIIVNKHKGSIHVESEEGKGATFTIVLPVNGLENV